MPIVGIETSLIIVSSFVLRNTLRHLLRSDAIIVRSVCFIHSLAKMKNICCDRQIHWFCFVRVKLFTSQITTAWTHNYYKSMRWRVSNSWKGKKNIWICIEFWRNRDLSIKKLIRWECTCGWASYYSPISYFIHICCSLSALTNPMNTNVNLIDCVCSPFGLETWTIP